jgi:hypothetical protein
MLYGAFFVPRALAQAKAVGAGSYTNDDRLGAPQFVTDASKAGGINIFACTA